MVTGNSLIEQRLDDLIGEGERQWDELQSSKGKPLNPARLSQWVTSCLNLLDSLSQWVTSCLNLLDKLSITSNRFVKQFERHLSDDLADGFVNVGGAVGVLKSARVEYSLGLAVEYHLSVSAAVFDGILDEAEYLVSKGYCRAAAVLIGAALEESLKTRARTMGIEVGPKDTLTPIIAKLKAPDVQVFNEFEAKRLESLARMRNDAAHGGDFNYQPGQVSQALSEVRTTLEQLLSHR